MLQPPQHRPRALITANVESSIRDALRAGDRDAATLAADFGVPREMVLAIRACLQNIMAFNGEGALPTPPPTSRQYFKRAFTEIEETIRAEYLNDPAVTPAGLAAKYGLKYQHVYNSILNRDPSVIALRAHQQAEAEAKTIELAKEVLSGDGGYEYVAKRLAMSVHEALKFVQRTCPEEYKGWTYRTGQRAERIPKSIKLEQYLQAWKLWDRQPSY